jgi:hypothetical protein
MKTFINIKKNLKINQLKNKLYKMKTIKLKHKLI